LRAAGHFADPDRFAVTVIGAERQAAYNRIMLSAVLAGDVAPEDIRLAAGPTGRPARPAADARPQGVLATSSTASVITDTIASWSRRASSCVRERHHVFGWIPAAKSPIASR
jgi:hypothetical protein